LALAIRLIFRLPNSQNKGVPMGGNNRIANSHARLLAGQRRYWRMPATMRSAKGIITMPTATTVPASAKLKDHAELTIQSLHAQGRRQTTLPRRQAAQ
jgi:hypothetical protein